MELIGQSSEAKLVKTGQSIELILNLKYYTVN